MYKEYTELGDCNPVIKVKDLWPHQRFSISGDRLDDDAPAIPCGLIAKSIFNDTFELFDFDGNGVFIDQTKIAWPSDIEHNFRNVYQNLPEGKNYTDVQWMS